MAKIIGFSRALKREWLDETAGLAVRGLSEAAVREELDRRLAPEIPSPTNARKVREQLMRTWVLRREEADPVYREALAACRSGSGSRMILHWCLLLTAFPVFSDICGLIGKLTAIQGTFSAAWLREKLYEEWGERSTLLYASRKILQTLAALDVIQREAAGVYTVKRVPVEDDAALSVIVAAVLSLKGQGYYTLPSLSAVPCMFPFSFEITPEWIYRSGQYRMANFGGKIVLEDG